MTEDGAWYVARGQAGSRGAYRCAHDPTDAHYTGLGGVAGMMATSPAIYAF